MNEGIATTRRYELVVPVELPAGMTPEDFLWQTEIEWGRGGHFETKNPAAYRQGQNLDTIPRFLGPKELRRVG